jgi:hypothetical protein
MSGVQSWLCPVFFFCSILFLWTNNERSETEREREHDRKRESGKERVGEVEVE